jgi:hypothetical protein
MEQTWEALIVSIWSNRVGCSVITVSIWSNCVDCLVITVLTRERDAAIILPWRQGAQTRLLSNLSTGNPRRRTKPLSWHNKSNLRWPNLLRHFQSSNEDLEINHFTEDWANEKSAWKTFPMQEMPQTSLLEESRTHEPDLWNRTSKLASTNWETESYWEIKDFT